MHVRINDVQKNELTEITHINMHKSQNNAEQKTSCKRECIIYYKVNSRQTYPVLLDIFGM